jgi:dienelactone hydrolase
MVLIRRALLALLGLSAFAADADLCAQARLMRPADLFEFERVGLIAWSPDRSHVAVEIHRRSGLLDRSVPTADIAVLDVASGTLRTVSPSLPDVVGFFSPAWSPDTRRLVFLSVDRDASVRAWLWSADVGAPTVLTDLELHAGLADPPVAAWHDSDHVVFMVRDPNRPNDGPLYSAIHRGRNVADQWTRVRGGAAPVVSVLDSWGAAVGTSTGAENTPQRRIVSVDVRTHAVTTIASGALHRPTLSGDGRTLTYWRENPSFSMARVATFFVPDAQGEAAYDAVNWGSEVHHVDLSTRKATAAPTGRAPNPLPSDAPSLRVTSTPSEGTRLVLSRPAHADVEVWRGNAWVADLQTGRAEAISYESTSGAPLTGWILYPPGHVSGRRIPIVTVVYPGTVYGDRTPGAFDIFNAQFNHPQLFAALGYAVALPSMPAADKLLQADALGKLTHGVIPFIDTLVARGIADPDRVAVVGQSAGGWATLGLISQTGRRFRTAVASASYSNLASLYGTFYGQYRYGDAGSPLRAQVLRMLQLERGFFGADAAPWQQPERYRVNSPIWRAAAVQTPLMLIHGEMDFIPVQQVEEFFTALYRQDKRVRLLRYTGEGHTIAGRANVLDLWSRLAGWLEETMPARRP